MRRVRVYYLYNEFVGMDDREFEWRVSKGDKSGFTQEYSVPDDISAYEIFLELGDIEEIAWWATNPPIDARKEWRAVAHNRGKKCSLCGFRIRNKNAIPHTSAYYKYCPKCGEEMGGVLENYVELNDEEWNEPVDSLEGRDF